MDRGITLGTMDTYLGRLCPDLSPKQQRALGVWNRRVTGLNKNGGKNSSCLAVRLSAVDEYQKDRFSLTDLADAFKALYPHWGPYNGSPYKTLNRILGKMHSSHWIPFTEAVQYRIPAAGYQSRNLSIPSKPSMILARRNCIIHPDSPVDYKKSGLCSRCHGKAVRLGILHLITLPVKEVIKHVMTTKMIHWKRGGACINHPERSSFDGTYCAECLINIDNRAGPEFYGEKCDRLPSVENRNPRWD